MPPAMMAPQFAPPVQQFVPPVAAGMPPAAGVQPPLTQPPAEPAINPNDLKALKDMFPDMDDDIIRLVLMQTGGDVDQAVNHLVSMAAT